MKKLLGIIISACLVQQIIAGGIVISAQKPVLINGGTEFPPLSDATVSSSDKVNNDTNNKQQDIGSQHAFTNEVGDITYGISNGVLTVDEPKVVAEKENPEIPSSISMSVASGNVDSVSNETLKIKETTSSTTTTTTTTTTPSTTTTTTEKHKNNEMLLIPPADVNASIAKIDTPVNKKGQVIISSNPDCPSVADADNMSQTQLIQTLTHECRYDRLERPTILNDKNERLPVDVYVRLYFYFLQNLEAHDLQYKIQALLQFRFVDPRLVFKGIAPSRTSPIMGEASLRSALWVPHIFIVNEKDSSILGTEDKDILTSISPDGTVIISSRIQATLSCFMNLQKFPFDEQECSTVFESWMYNTSELVMHWEPMSPVTLAPKLHLTEYVLLNSWTNETVVNADTSDLSHGAFAGNYSCLKYTIHIAREMGFYLMDYFLPSMMIVSISWVSFWLQADQSAPRVMLGCTTMLTFITLSSGQSKNLPKVSYIKVSEVWFLGCTAFIFGSLMEFAFVNTIWRRKKNVELKKVNSKYILKSTLTPRPHRKEMGLQKSRSCSSLDAPHSPSTPNTPTYNNYLTVHSFNSKTNLPTITTQSCDDVRDNGDISINIDPNSSLASIPVMKDGTETPLTGPETNHYGWTTMTPQEISTWIDRRSRLVFPCAFVVFNAFFWTFVYCL